jgi:copper(I)-binding protein
VYVPLGNSKTTTAFFTIKNNNNEAVSITKISSTTVKKINLVPAVPTKENTPNPWLIPVGQVLVLKPERQYLQLTGLKNSLTTGDELQLEVSLSNGKKLVVIARAKSAFDQIHGH